MKNNQFLILLLFILFYTTACDQTPEATPTPTPDPLAILQQAGETMQALDSARFEMTRTGGPIYLDPEQQLLFNATTGHFAAPDAVRALIRVQAIGLALEVNTIAIGEEQWLTNPLTRQWEKLPPGWGFNPAILFDQDIGWEALLRENVTNVGPIEIAELDGRTLYHVEATVAGDRVRVMTAGLAGDEPVILTIWIDPATHHVVRIGFTSTSPTGEPTEWLLTFSEFNAPVTIEPPPAN